MLGNGFSIDIIKKAKREEDIDLTNLFSMGTEVPWPGTKLNGFLSYKYCKSLWTLGARTTMSKDECNKLIEDIITCVNVYNYSRQNSLHENDQNNNVYIRAYGELTTYLRYLIIYYNLKITNDELKEMKIPLIKYIQKCMDKYEEIIIIDYNYDIFLERLLLVNDIGFCIEGFEENQNAKVKIIKPHGSISFSFKTKITGPFRIRTSEFDDISQDVSHFDIKYELKEDYPIVNAIIPPAGDSNRCNMGWIKVLREKTQEKIKMSESRDKLIIFGISYWHVDRMEIDEILTNINPSIDVINVNPSPPTCLNAVLTSLYENYIHYKDSKLLEENQLC